MPVLGGKPAARSKVVVTLPPPAPGRFYAGVKKNRDPKAKSCPNCSANHHHQLAALGDPIQSTIVVEWWKGGLANDENDTVELNEKEDEIDGLYEFRAEQL
jgi:hypothetical protein